MAKTNKLQTKKESPTKTSETGLFDDVADIIRLMGETGLAELDLEASGVKISLRRQSACTRIDQIPTGNGFQAVTPMFPMPQPPLSNPAPASTPVAKPIPSTPPVEAEWHKVVSPMAGTFYRAPAPTAPQFVKVGDLVKVGQPICIVEAMKLMNEIKADKAGKIVNILVENGKPVEKGTPLFHIDTGV